MANLEQRLNAFIKLGTFFKEFCEYSKKPIDLVGNVKSQYADFHRQTVLAEQHNGWFTQENILFSLSEWSKLLTENKLGEWLNPYNLNNIKPKTVALIMAGNIPLVGFHDFISAMLTGNKVLIKLSSNDKILFPFIVDYLCTIAPSLKNEISIAEGQLKAYDAVIATGSNNTSRYFEYYFGKQPNIIRKNRNSVAVLSGNEKSEELYALGEDIFRYYGLGCRSVSKLFVPKDYDFDVFFKAIYPYHSIIDKAKYANNYDYNKAVYLMGGFKILDNGFLILKEDKSYASPIATLFYEHYTSEKELRDRLQEDEEKLQCVVARGWSKNEVPFGHTQMPTLMDYADGVDTVDFLLRT